MNLTPFAFGREYNYPFKVCKQTLVQIETMNQSQNPHWRILNRVTMKQAMVRNAM
jgi:hypothetical protein